MKCTSCLFENPDGANFCNGCGCKLELICTECTKANPPGSRFCNGCGQNLTLSSKPTPKELSFDEKLQKIQRYLPQGLTEKILSQRDRIEGEHKQVTVMFCDMKGFTTLSEKLSPEAIYAMMDQVYEILIHKVHEFDGTVNEMTGDGVMALFGAPIALEDAPQRAIRSAIAIHREMTKFNEKIKQEKGTLPPLKMRVGIHTGPVVVGTLGNDLRVEFKAVGDTVNLASRMESLAEPGITYISEDTFKATEGLFRVESLGEKEIKGKEKPIRVYQVIAPSTRRTRFDVSAERGLTPFVGRQRGLELLMDGYERSKEGRGQAISIISEAGIGKSRLLYEFRKSVTNEDITFLEGKCLSYSRNVAYHPIVDVLKANFDIQDNDSGPTVRKKVTIWLNTIGVDEASTRPYLLELLAVKESGLDKSPMSPETRKDRTLQALKKIVLKGSELRPLIMAIEDLHWMDRSSEDALKELLESISGSRIFLIVTYRPEFVHTWGARSYHSQITLNRLSNRESLTMVSHLLNSTHIDKEVEDLVLTKTEGIPFFIEEFIKSLNERNIIEKVNGTFKLTKDFKTITIPSTIHDVIMARVDHLPEATREVLRTGSVIEREFSHKLIQKVTDLPETELLSQLSTLRDSELLYERGIYPASTYIFKHALTREVVYDSILSKKKKQIHAKIARTIEELYGENICDCYGILSNHCMASEDYEKAAEYSRLEARKYQKAASFKDAIEYAKRSIACLEKLPQNEAVRKRIIDARVVLSVYYLNLNYHIEAKEAVESVIQLAVDLNYRKRLSGIYTAMGLYYITVEEDYSKGTNYFNDVFEIAEKAGDFLTLWFANFFLAGAICNYYQFDVTSVHLKTVLDLGLLSNNLAGISHSKAAIAMNYNFQGKQSLAFQMSREALESATETGDIQALQNAHTNHGVSYYYKGRLHEAEKHLMEALAYYEKATIGSWGCLAAGYLGYTYEDRKEYGKAGEYFKKCILMMEDIKLFPSWHNVHKLFMTKAKILNNETDIDLHDLNTLLANHEKNRLAVCESFGTRCIAEIYMNIDDQYMAEAGSWIKRAIDFNTKHDTRWELARDHALYAEWFKKKGDISRAREQLSRAIGLFKECGADGWVEKYETELAGM
jgi:class 3 adenylate cyclase/tetratricopeptide (TPR) repeat protein